MISHQIARPTPLLFFFFLSQHCLVTHTHTCKTTARTHRQSDTVTLRWLGPFIPAGQSEGEDEEEERPDGHGVKFKKWLLLLLTRGPDMRSARVTFNPWTPTEVIPFSCNPYLFIFLVFVAVLNKCGTLTIRKDFPTLHEQSVDLQFIH